MQHLQPNTTLQGGKYRIERVLGQGGFGITYLARNTVFDVDVAIKEFFMKDENDRDGSSVTMPNTTKQELFYGQMEKFKKEAKRMFAIKNEHIIGVQDLFEENGTAYYVMDFVDGENLAEHLKRTGKPMSEQEVRDILSQILDALKSVHDAGIWHLDLKPANIIVDKDGNVKLIDFGASKQLNAQKGGATTSTAISYTNGYAPREQMEQNYDKFGPWTDIYALGATLYNLLTNKRPPLPTDIDDDMSEDKHLALPFPKGVSDGMKYSVLWMMKTNRLQRPQNIGAIVEAEKKIKGNSEHDQKQQPTPSPIAVYDDEATIIAESKPKREVNKPESKTEPQTTAHTSYTSLSQDSNDSKDFGKGIIIVMIVAILLVISVLINKGSCSSVNINQEVTESSNLQYVEDMQYDTPIGSCSYSGSVDIQGAPDGSGEAFFSDGRFYKGEFRQGEISGSGVLKDAEGNEYNGIFNNGVFAYGTYTETGSGNFFEGSFLYGNPTDGTWYDKSGKILLKIGSKAKKQE